MNKKKKSRKIWGILMLFVPTIIAGIVLANYLSDDIAESDVLKIVVSTNGEETEFDEKSDVDFFVSVLSGGVEISETANEISNYSKATVTYVKLNNEFDYTFYLSDSADDCLYKDPDEKLFRIASETATELLLRDEFKRSYSNSEVPTAALMSGDNKIALTAISADWNYKNISGEFLNVKANGTPEGVSRVGSDAIMSLKFSDEPDTCDFELKQGTEILFEGDIDSISDFFCQNDCELTLSVTAEWFGEEDDEETERYGKVKYEANIYYDVDATCTLSEETTDDGELIFLVMHNAAGDKYSVSCDFEVPEIKLYDNGYDKIGLIPVPLGTKAGSYTVKISGQKDLELPLTVTEKSYPKLKISLSHIGLSSDEYVKLAESEASAEAGYSEKSGDELFIKSALSHPTGSDKSPFVDKFGSYIVLDGKETELRQNGISYGMEEGAQVYAPCGGKVVSVRESKIYGKTVTINHGFGLISSYCYLDDITVAEGDTVSIDQIIGKVAKNPYGTQPVVGVSTMAGGIYVNPASVIASAYSFLSAELPENNLVANLEALI